MKNTFQLPLVSTSFTKRFEHASLTQCLVYEKDAVDVSSQDARVHFSDSSGKLFQHPKNKKPVESILQ